MSLRWTFDEPAPQALNQARMAFLHPVLADLANHLELRSAVDVGCGVGYFSGMLENLGFQVLGIDGRPDNVEEAARRHTTVQFETGDIEDPGIPHSGRFDLVFCVGLLYHLENPFRAIRNLEAMTERVMVAESTCLPERRPAMLLQEEGPTEDQGLRHIALYPSEGCLVKMLYRAGFAQVYGFARLPDHAEFEESRTTRRRRTLLVASRAPLPLHYLRRMPEPTIFVDPWETRMSAVLRKTKRTVSFLRSALKA